MGTRSAQPATSAMISTIIIALILTIAAAPLCVTAAGNFTLPSIMPVLGIAGGAEEIGELPFIHLHAATWIAADLHLL